MPVTKAKRVVGVLCAVALVSVCANVGAASAGPKSAPSLATPGAGASVDAAPAFSWNRVRGSSKYEFQLAADPAFESIVDYGAFQTRNTFATIDEALPNGDYYWRVRSINENENAGRWSRTRNLKKNWNNPPPLLSPVQGEPISYPKEPLVLRWNPVPRAYKYLVWIGTDPSLSTLDKPIETSATVLSPPEALGPGRYYWAVTPVDAQGNRGTRSGVGAFDWVWPSQTAPRVADLNADLRVFDPFFGWDAVAGASSYELEINPSADFAVGSKVCCSEVIIGTSHSPKKTLPNNTYYWRMRAVDLDGQAGVWNYGEPFRQAFDDVQPTIPNLHMRDNVSDAPVDPDTGTPELETSYPIVRWNPVPGAASYEVEVAPYENAFAFCNWTAQSSKQWQNVTATTAWTPMASSWNGQQPSVQTQSVSYDGGKSLVADQKYCVRVRARGDRDAKSAQILSEWTQIGGVNTPAFKWVQPPAGGLAAGPGFTTPAQAYLEPQTGVQTRMPLFTWQPVNGAASYFVVIAKDQGFTQIVDTALTNLPMYAPRKGSSAVTYPDETTSYYWAVIPATGPTGSGAASEPKDNFPRTFEKRSVPPTLITPAEGQDVLRQPVFSWQSAEDLGARNYTLQVATDPSFSNLLDDVTTAATSYTSEKTYPADTVIYWRVRANDENGIGLSWSQIGTFRRRLPVPTLFGDNPTAGETIPVLRWNPVEGATSYTISADEPDGDKKSFDMRGTAFTLVTFYGTGNWHWQVRANFPSGARSEVSGGYTPMQRFTRHIATPTNLKAVNKDRHLLLRWNPANMARRYRVEISTTDSFSTIVDRTTTDHTSWAPKLTSSDFLAGGKFYWRVATVDEGNNYGAWRVARPFRMIRGFDVLAAGLPMSKRTSVINVYVRDGRRRPVRRAKVVVTGAGMRRRVARTNGSGEVDIKVKPRKRGWLKFKVSKRGFRTMTEKLEVKI